MRHEIDTSGWRIFQVEELFDTEKMGRKIQVPTGSWMASKNLMSGSTPRITVSGVNNGITGYYKDVDDVNYRVYENFISVSFLGTVFYQASRASLDMKVHCLKPLNIELNESVASFLVTMIKAALGGIEYSDQISSTVLPSLELMLPVDASGEPDWAYMDAYMSKMLAEEQTYAEKLSEHDFAKHEIDTSGWKEFVIDELFEKLTLKITNPDFNKALDVSEVRTNEFSLPLVNAKHGNNGIMFYGRKTDFESAEMTLDVVQNGAIATGDVYPQPQNTGVLWDAYLIKPKENITSLCTLQFLATAVEKAIKSRFSYDDKCVWDKAKKLAVKLPVTSSGVPDWDFMNAYMSKLMDEEKAVADELTA